MPQRITDVANILVGHFTDVRSGTGCTVVLGPANGMRAAVNIRGRATGTRELDALSPTHLVPGVHGILLTGGSAFGLGAADGVMRWLAERGRGFDAGVSVVPIVPSAVIFDLAFGKPSWPIPADGYRACEAAGIAVAEGSVGAGTGATVGKVLGITRSMKSGLGTWSERRDDVLVGSLAVVNAFGDVRDCDGVILAGARSDEGFLDSRVYLADGGKPGGSFLTKGVNTTLVVVATNARLSKPQATKLAQLAQVGLARTVSPAHSPYDGDVIFTLSLGNVDCDIQHLGALAELTTSRAIIRAVKKADGFGVLQAWKDLIAP